MPSLQCLYHLAPSPCAVTSVTLRCTPLPVTSTRAWSASSGVTTSTAREGGWTSSERACPSWPSISFAPVCSEPRSDLQCWQIFIIWSCNGLLYNEYDQSHFALGSTSSSGTVHTGWYDFKHCFCIAACFCRFTRQILGGHAFAFASLQDRVGFTKYVQIVVGETMRNNFQKLLWDTLGFCILDTIYVSYAFSGTPKNRNMDVVRVWIPCLFASLDATATWVPWKMYKAGCGPRFFECFVFDKHSVCTLAN